MSDNEGISVCLHFPDGESPIVPMTAVPRKGDIIEWDHSGGYSEWIVTKVSWAVSMDSPGMAGLFLAAHADEK
ncbi:hypothetical protein [Streptomyces sp. NPDC002853]